MAKFDQKPLQEIVIVGGGSAGWMTAAALSSMLDPKAVRITLVESDQIGTVGVGEATIPDIINFNHMLGISEAEFLKATNGTFKLGIEFIDWGRIGDSYVHPFGMHGVNMNGIDFHQYWLHSKAHGNPTSIQEYALSAVAAKQNKFTLPDPNPKSVFSHIRYAYHFDATLYAKFLRHYAEEHGVQRVEGKVINISQHPETGYISHLEMESGTAIEGELFFDCTGFAAMLLGRVMGVGYEDWSHWLPCNTAQAIPCEHHGPLTPYTRSTAKKAGWQWRIPTQNRTGNGHIYSSEFMGDDEAVAILLDGLDGQPLADPRKISFTAGHRHKFWEKNCIAIGLSAGFLEPLESTSLYLIQQGISRFIALFPDATLPAVIQGEYNRFMTQDFEQVRDFIILHYCATERDDSPFWNYCRNMSLPDSLTWKMDLFTTAGRIFRYEEELFSKDSWLAVFLGQNIMPKSYDTIVGTLPADQVTESIQSMQMAMAGAAQKMPTHAEFIARYCASERS
jgi:tryptophan 7-halogenase